MSSARPPSEDLIRRLSKYQLSVGELALKARELILATTPSAVETLYEGYALVFWYSLTGRMRDAYCYVGVYSNHVNIGFYRGAELNNVRGRLEGDGKIMRHVKIKNAGELKGLRSLIRAAEKNARVIAASKPERRPARSNAAARSKKRP
jgi:hypothetical protein